MDNTPGVAAASPLTVNAYESGNEDNNSILLVALYYMNLKHQLTRTTGKIEKGQVTWEETRVVIGTKKMCQYSLLAVANKDDRNFVYYIPDDSASSEYVAAIDHPFTKDFEG